ncbi:MAG TPA: response regulator transcription factor [Candidatus Scatomorpha merdipullorum]|uniref:Stage 0 sporulation protein A homolog n=1 Tax=Candidatus Scatomorpha merdipullorum TaxID=2840927 RepID=A0A9D1JV78_9FIRM|nr:response regulator transcription factor [Candidatus Scatomorpha merdipullorum]
MNYRILVVEDDAVIAAAVAKHIGAWGCEVRVAENFADIMAEFTAFEPQLVLLDIALPFYNGYHWCSEIRKVSRVPVMFISSASDSMNIVMAMNMGADDFIAKPFDLTVLTAKVQALLRRTYDFAGGGNTLSARGAVLDLAAGTLDFEGRQLTLTKNELKILQSLLEKHGQVVSRDELMLRLWQTDSFVDENTLTVNITRLRKKLDSIGLGDFISTRKGLGYAVEQS